MYVHLTTVERTLMWIKAGASHRRRSSYGSTAVLRPIDLKYESGGLYTLNYRTGNTALSVSKVFFITGNDRMWPEIGWPVSVAR
jgi:hypothetical protein